MQYFIDTNIFLRTLVKEDQKSFHECISLLRLVKENKIKVYTSSIVLAEIAWILSSFYKLGKKDVIKATNGIVNLRGLKFIDKTNPRVAINIYQSKPIKFIDCLIASDERIKKRIVTAISYDKDFDKIGVHRKEPGELITTRQT